MRDLSNIQPDNKKIDDGVAFHQLSTRKKILLKVPVGYSLQKRGKLCSSGWEKR